MIRILILLCFAIFSRFGVAQENDVRFSYHDHFSDLHKAKQVINWSDRYVESEERQLDAYIRSHFMTGNQAKDSIIFYRIKREYHHGVGNIIGDTYAHLKLLTLYHKYLTEEDLEPMNRKVGESFESLGNYALAQAFYNKALSYENGRFRPYLFAKLGSCFIQAGDLDSAQFYYNKASSFAENNLDRVVHLNSVGYVHYLNGEYKKARRKYDEALNVFSEERTIDSIQYYIIQSNIGSLEIVTGNVGKGVETLEKVRNSHFFQRDMPWFQSEIYLKLGHVYLDQGKCEEARRAVSNFESMLSVNERSKDHLLYYQLKLKLDVSCQSNLLIIQPRSSDF